MSRLPPRRLALLGALGLSLAATAWVATGDAGDDDAAAPRPRPAPAAPAARGAESAGEPPAPGGNRGDWPAPDELARAAWGEAAPAAPAPPAPPPPVQAAVTPAASPAPPPFPYQFVGRMSDGATRAVLNNAQRSAVVGLGEVVDGQWRVEAVEAGGLRLTYLPLGRPQFVPFASSPSA